MTDDGYPNVNVRNVAVSHSSSENRRSSLIQVTWMRLEDVIIHRQEDLSVQAAYDGPDAELFSVEGPTLADALFQLEQELAYQREENDGS